MSELEIGLFVEAILIGNRDKESLKKLITEAKANTEGVRIYLSEIIGDHDMAKVVRTGRPVIRSDIQGTIDKIIKGLLAETEKTTA